jgi:hypothetical protein
MNDETSANTMTRAPLRRREAAPEAVAEAPVKMSPYVVKGADIWTTRGRHPNGATVDLTPAEARHFTKKGLLAPFIPGEELEG